jgi:hypothetical protein
MPYVVEVTLIFDEPCMGNIRNPDPEPNTMLRNSEGRVIFHQAWWRTIMIKASEAYFKHQQLVKKITWTPEIDGTLCLIKRYYTKIEGGARIRCFKPHEGFDRGSVIGVKALVPDGIPIGDFKELLSLAGEHFGISPFGWKLGYGKFKVKEVRQVYGIRHRSLDNTGQPDVDPSGNHGPAAPGGEADHIH